MNASTLADFQAVATELAKLLPSDVPLEVNFVPNPPAEFNFDVEYHSTMRRVGANEINLMLIVDDVVVAPLAKAGLGFEPEVALRTALEQVSGALGEAVTVDFTPELAQFREGETSFFVLRAGPHVRGWFGIQIREGGSVGNDFDSLNDGATQAKPASISQFTEAATPVRESVANVGNMRLLYDVEMTLTAEIGRAKLPVRQILDLTPGAIVELDRVAGSPADLMVNGHLVARGEVVVIDEDYGLRITEILDASEAFA